MKTIHTRKHLLLRFFAVAIVLYTTAWAQNVSYQGSLKDNGAIANGSYDFQFNLFDGPDPNTASVISTYIANNVTVTDGVFSTEVNFGPGVFDGTGYWIELGVRPGNSTGSFDLLFPLQAINPTPEALFSFAIANGTVGNAQLQNGSVTGAKIADNTVSGQKIQNSAISNIKLANSSVSTPKLQDGSVTQAKIGNGQVGSGQLAFGAVLADKIAIGAVGSPQLANGSVNVGKLATNSVTTEKISAGSITTDKIAPNAITSINITDGGVQTTDLADSSITLSKMADNSITTDKVVNGSLTAADTDTTSLQVRVHGSCPTGSSIRAIAQSGSVLCETDDGVDAALVWGISGNTINNGDFLGSVNSIPLVLKTKNLAVARFIDASDGSYHSPNVILGSEDNYVGPTWHGATIAGGGGQLNDNVCGPNQTLPCVNQADGHYNSIGGGEGNVATAGNNSTISGGYRNTVSGSTASIAGGDRNVISATHGSIGGGQLNSVLATSGTVPGGFSNQAGGRYSFAAGYRATVRDSVAAGNSTGDDGSFVWADFSSATPFTSTGINQFLIRAAGGVGVGTSDPKNQLHVVKNTSGNTENTHVVKIQNLSTSTQASVLALKINRSSLPGSSNNFITFFKGGINQAVGAIDGDGSGGVTYRSGSADFAEYLPNGDSEGFVAGEVVALKRGHLWKNTDHAEKVLVVSSTPLLVGNSDMQGDVGKTLAAFTGQVLVKVNGDIKAGEILIASGRHDGRAVSLHSKTGTDYTQIIGRALENSQNGMVLALVGLPEHALLQRQQHQLRQLEQDIFELRELYRQLQNKIEITR